MTIQEAYAWAVAGTGFMLGLMGLLILLFAWITAAYRRPPKRYKQRRRPW